MICKRKHNLFDRQYQLYLSESSILIGKDANTIKYQIDINLQTQLEWKLNQQLEYKGFKVKEKKEKYFLMSHHDCLTLKNFIDSKVAYTNINQFYSPQEVIGEGSFGKVLLIKSIRDNQFFATKTLKNDLMTSLEDIQDEILALQTLNHQNVVTLKEIFLHKQYWLLVMEYCEGGSLKEYLKTHIIDNSEIIIIMRQLLAGLTYIHDQGYVHRDIKPENILFRKKETISDLVISDFGFAVKINDIITNRPRCGTPGYIAPEIISFDQTNNYNELCDVFSCGVVLYQLMTGVNLVSDSNKSIDQKTFINQLLKQNDLQSQFSEILKKMLEPNPLKRITAREALYFFTDLNDLSFYQETSIQELKHISIHQQRR